jgi:hypothetical protein
MLHGRACPVAEVDGGRRLSCAGEGSLQRCIGSYRLTLDRRSGRAARRCSEGQAHPPSRSTDSLPGVPITGRETSPVTRRAAAGLQTHGYDEWTVDELHSHTRPAGRVRDTK